jgi:hypothetical protein
MTVARALADLRRRRTVVRATLATAPWLATGLAATVVVAAVVRLTVPGGHPVWLAVLIAALVAPLWPLIRALRDREPDWLVAGHLDRMSGANGLVMAAAERPAEAWAGHMAVPLAGVHLPVVPVLPLIPVLLSVTLLPAIPLLPPAPPSPPAPAPIVRTVSAPLADRLAALAPTLPAEEAAQFAAALEALRSATAAPDAAAWEALDRLARRIDGRTADQSARIGRALAAAALVQEPGQSPAQLEAVTGDLVQALAAVAAAAPLPTLPQELAQILAQAAAAQGGTVPADLARLTAGATPGPGAPNPADLAALGAWVEGALDAHRRALAALGQDPTAPADGPGGNGGVNRGPGHAGLVIDPRDPLPVGAPEALPPGVRLNADGSLTIAETIRDPATDERVDAARQAAVQAVDPTAADARRVRTAPRHQAAVGAYFAPGGDSPAP